MVLEWYLEIWSLKFDINGNSVVIEMLLLNTNLGEEVDKQCYISLIVFCLCIYLAIETDSLSIGKVEDFGKQWH